MADYDLKSDDEKAEELKAWWKENGTSVIAGVALTIGGMFGYQQWQQYKLDQSEGASKIYSKISKNSANPDKVSEALKQLNNEYGSTPYASLAALSTAKTNCEAGKIDDCIAQLKIASKSSQDNIAFVAKIRLARTLVNADKLDQAQTILAEKMPAAYSSLVTELMGDLYYAKKEFSKARDAYDRAILSSSGKDIEILQMKRDDLSNQKKSGA